MGEWKLHKARVQSVAMPLPGLPVIGDAAGLDIGAARSYPIGWFDLDNIWDAVPAFREAEDNEAPASSARALSPEDDFLRRLAARLQPPLSRLTAPNGVLEWPAPLLPYQQEGIAALLSRRELLLADDMGLGKTIQAIAALRILFFQQRMQNALVVCPASLLAQWRRELARWASDLQVVTISGSPLERSNLWRIGAHVRLVSYETLRMDVVEIADSPARRTTWDVVVLDEASRIKNRESGNAIACKRLRRTRRWALTGTPLENSLEDVISLLEFLHGEPGEPANLPCRARRNRFPITRRATAPQKSRMCCATCRPNRSMNSFSNCPPHSAPPTTAPKKRASCVWHNMARICPSRTFWN